MSHTTFYVRLGSLLRERREAMHLSMREVGVAAAVSWQQIQKYEQGQSALSVERLLTLCRILHVEPSHIVNILCYDAPGAPFTERAAVYLERIRGEDKQQAVMTFLHHLSTTPPWAGGASSAVRERR